MHWYIEEIEVEGENHAVIISCGVPLLWFVDCGVQLVYIQ